MQNGRRALPRRSASASPPDRTAAGRFAAPSGVAVGLGVEGAAVEDGAAEG